MQTSYKTQRLSLRLLKPTMAFQVLSFYEENREFLEPFEPKRMQRFYTLEFQRSNLECEFNAFFRLTHVRFWIFLRGNREKPIGTVCFNNILKGSFCSCMVGYKLGKDYCKKGYMHEALCTLIPVVAKECGLHRVEAMVMPENSASVRLLQRLGFAEEGYLREFAQINGEWRDHLLYSLLV